MSQMTLICCNENTFHTYFCGKKVVLTAHQRKSESSFVLPVDVVLTAKTKNLKVCILNPSKQLYIFQGSKSRFFSR